METFSQRYGYKSVRDALQTHSIDTDLRNCLWNVITEYYWKTYVENRFSIYPDQRNSLYNQSNKDLCQLCSHLWSYHFKLPMDDILNDWPRTISRIRTYYFECEWYEVYDFIEFVSQNYSIEQVNEEFREGCNEVLEKEMSAYRFVGDKITRLIDKVEIEAIEDAINYSSDQVREHLNTALTMFSDRSKPNYRNSIKESISAVESLVMEMTGQKKSLGKLLDKLEHDFNLHNSFRQALDKLYGYTSDEDGIRHALLDEPKVDFEDAKFMLVTCSTFVNYVRGKLNEEDTEISPE